MKFLLDFFHQKVPKSGTEMPGYFRNALVCSEKMLAVYFFLTGFIIFWRIHKVEILPIALLLVMVLCIVGTHRMSMPMNINVFTAGILIWCGWYIYAFGWGCGGQHFLLPLLLLFFFNIFDPPWMKIANLIGLISYRMLLFAYSLRHPGLYSLDSTTNIIFQTVNSVTLFLVLAVDYIIFSSSIQNTERELRLNNQELHKEADTDPLTQLPNRRAMLERISRFRGQLPDAPFSVAIGDIDFFKKVNDTYGHNCGDYTLRELAKLFREKAGQEYFVCRWGGEEFCFFMPGKNIDEAWNYMFDLCVAVRKMRLEFEKQAFSITITIGIEENDYQSSIETILEKADKKLYMGKMAGRNRVVM